MAVLKVMPENAQRPAKTGWFEPNSSKNPFPIGKSGGNCTWYAYGRFCQAANKKIRMSSYSHAKYFYDNFPTCKKGNVPKPGSIICWTNSSYGHVEFVEEVYSNGDIRTTGDGAFHGWRGSKKYTHNSGYKLGSGDTLRGFIYNPVEFDSVELDPSLNFGTFGEDAESVTVSFKQGAETLYSSDNFKYLEQSEDAATAFAKNINSKLKERLKDLFTEQPAWPPKDETFAANFIDIVLTRFKVEQKEKELTLGSLATYPNLVAAPFIQINMNGVVVGGYNGTEDKYPNHVNKLEIDKVNGRINQYTIQLEHQIRAGEDPNFIDSLLSRTGVRNKIQIVYGDAAYGALFKEDEAYITNVTYNENITSAKINYTISAISSVGSLQSAVFDFPAITSKPSTEINNLLYGNLVTSKHFLETFTGMANKTAVMSNGWIPTDDDELLIPGATGATLISRVQQLVSYMRDSSSPTSSYFLSFNDSSEGAFFKINKINKLDSTNSTVLKNCYYIDVGYPGNELVLNFSLQNDTYWPIYFNYADSILSYNYDIDSSGNLISKKVNPLILNSKYETVDVKKMNWWNIVKNYPVTASVTIRGLMKPVLLMENVYVHAQFYGSEDIASGVYSIIGQHDSISSSGYTTTLTLLRVQN